MLIALDLDGCVVDFIGATLSAYEQAHGYKFVPDDVRAHDLVTSFGWEHYERMIALFNAPGFFAGLKPYPGAIGTVEMLIDAGHTIEIVTSPTVITLPSGVRSINGAVAAEKFDWVARYLPKLAKRVTITKAKHLVRADVLIDDGDHNYRPWCEAWPTGLAVVVDQPWNRQDVIPKNAVRSDFIRVPELLAARS